MGGRLLSVRNARRPSSDHRDGAALTTELRRHCIYIVEAPATRGLAGTNSLPSPGRSAPKKRVELSKAVAEGGHAHGRSTS